MGVCRFCEEVLFHDLDWKDEEHEHHDELDEWTKSLGELCVICQALWDNVKFAIRQSTGHQPELPTDEKIVKQMGETLPLYKVLLTGSPIIDHFTLHFSLLKREIKLTVSTDVPMDVPLSLVTIKFKIAPCDKLNPGSPSSRSHLEDRTESFTQIRQWLDLCDAEEHSRCHLLSHRTESYVPRRLIDLDPEKPDTVRLIDTGYSTEYKIYATLSHCWGPVPMKLMLLRSNIDQLKESIPLDDSFPRNFRDAVQVARAIGIRYIWIDSLCIIQKDDNDWVEEGLKMDQIYGCSYLNIAVACSDNSEGGLFRDRHAKALQPATFDTIDWQRQPMACTLLQDNFWTNELLSEPLYSRAWVLQERMLSSRTIHFGRRQLFWQCLTVAACETMPRGIPTAFADQASHDELQWRQLLTRNTPTDRLTMTNRVDLQDLWKHAVKTYTTCDITNNTDKIPAIAGLAKMMRASSGERWVAGLWEIDLIEQMAWKVEDCRQANGSLACRQTPSEYRAPSWAWPSVDGIIKIPSRVESSRDYKLEVVSGPHLVFKDIRGPPDEFGKLESGHLEVRGDLYRLPFVKVSEKSQEMTLKLEGPRASFYLRPDEPIYGPEPKSRVRDVLILFLFYNVEAGRDSVKYSGNALAVEETEGSNSFSRIGLIEFHSVHGTIWADSISSRRVDGAITIILK